MALLKAACLRGTLRGACAAVASPVVRAGRRAGGDSLPAQVVHQGRHRSTMTEAAVALGLWAESHDAGERQRCCLPKIGEHLDGATRRVVD